MFNKKKLKKILKNKRCLYIVAGSLLFITLLLIIFSSRSTLLDSGLRVSANRINVRVNGRRDGLVFTEQITLRNTTDNAITFSLNWENVNNSFINQQDLTFNISQIDGGNNNQEITQVPAEDTVAFENITIPAGAKHTYEIEIFFNRYDNSEDGRRSRFTSKIVVES